ncbi:hypothetical protein MJG53_010935 [Ovis ammon polii x Ovis aries]|uniref:Uncharacterized protein n=1 Tax=Ovis ammon polii x Ovis aries TaxID=2918886 RepID=A0ACB9URN2_9CETA|nr:hypothetical protein MJG53_010935 [Ovis ammon polii x Ovis aries]
MVNYTDYLLVLPSTTSTFYTLLFPLRGECIFHNLENGYNPSSEKKVLQGETVRVRCYHGYSLQNYRNIMTCTESGWSPPPRCIRVKRECSIPEMDTYLNAYPRKDTFEVGDVLKFSCSQGRIMVGADSVQCYHFGWSPRLPTCKVRKVKSCAPPPQLLNGKGKETHKEEYAHNEVVEYACNSRFLMKGSHKIQCVDGEWTALPVCIATDELKKCKGSTLFPPEGKPAHTIEYDHNTNKSYRCRGKSEHKHSICINGEWDPKVDCKEGTNCVNLPTFDDAVLIDREKDSYKSGEQVAFKCLSYYQLDGANTIQCIKGKWIGRPACRDVSCVNPPQVENAIIQNQKSRYQSGERARYECVGNYDLFGEIDVVCLDGTWTKPPQCKDSKGKCGPPPPIDNGDITSLLQSVYPPGMIVEYRCQASYELQGNRNVVCRNGEWSEPPKCLEACVISEETMRKHHIQLKWKHDKKLYSKAEDTIEFTCRYGYRPRTALHTFRTTCREGKVVYPQCG